MKNVFKCFGAIAFVAVIGFSFAALFLTGCGGGDGGVIVPPPPIVFPDLPGTITIIPTTATVGTELTASYSGEEAVSYQWKNGSNNVGTNSNKFTPTEEGSYTVTVSAAGYKKKTSAAVIVRVPRWTAVTDSTFGTNIISAIAYGNGTFVAGSYNGKMAYSTDGVTWTAVSNTTFGTSDIRAIAYGNGKFVAGGSGGKMATSTDGETWTAVSDSTFDATRQINAIAFGNGKFVAGGGKTATSTDGVTWTTVSDSTFVGTNQINAIAYDGSKRFVAVGSNGKIAYSDN